ncbi:DUF1801 domain-containing protein [Ottowia thiooxydans]|uniref:DUF1801 domain-containing protein n=1 Tax=Ottowia thiooxydans TaxID=219182 RepID=UPI0004138226|nr:DUF1801 domain-containing protein [Ottowia thiooxydans]
MKAFADPDVEARFNAYPPHVRQKMRSLRNLIFKVAAATDGVGEIQETLKWGEPAYVTAATRSGSTIRMDWKNKQPEQFALYFNCNTNLVDTFRTLFPDDFKFEGNRALVFNISDNLPTDELAFCIGASLTYHAQKRLRKQKVSSKTPD